MRNTLRHSLDSATPDKAFAAAIACGLGTALETLAVRSAFAHLPLLPPGARLT